MPPRKSDWQSKTKFQEVVIEDMTRIEVAQQFLNDLFGPIPQDSCIEVRTKRNDQPSIQRVFLPNPSTLRIDQSPPDTHFWFGVCLRRLGSAQGRTEDLTWGVCAWADFDNVPDKDDLVHRLKRYQHPPSFIVDSGGGVH